MDMTPIMDTNHDTTSYSTLGFRAMIANTSSQHQSTDSGLTPAPGLLEHRIETTSEVVSILIG